MSADARHWFAYAEENRQAAVLCLEGNLFNACLQNAQQAVEKTLKALHLMRDLPLKKTHSIAELRRDHLAVEVDPGLSENAADLLDTIYLPSKYPLRSVLADFEPDAEMARRCVSVADQVLAVTGRHFSQG